MTELKDLKRYSTYEIIEAGVHTMFHLCSDVEALIKEKELLMPQWVSVDEDTENLVKDMLWHTDKGFIFVDKYSDIDFDIWGYPTHYMPLPPTPKAPQRG